MLLGNIVDEMFVNINSPGGVFLLVSCRAAGRLPRGPAVYGTCQPYCKQ